MFLKDETTTSESKQNVMTKFILVDNFFLWNIRIFTFNIDSGHVFFYKLLYSFVLKLQVTKTIWKQFKQNNCFHYGTNDF